MKVLVPVDFSDESTFAIHYAANLKDRFDLEVLLLHVVEIGSMTDINTDGHFDDFMGINTEMLEIQHSTAKEQMEQLLAESTEELGHVHTYIKLGPLIESIVSFAHHQKVDMILMGTKGAGKLRSWISGSDTQIVARRSEIPVLTVMCDRSHSNVDHLLFISDFSDLDVAPDPVIIKLQEGFDAKLHLLCIAALDANDDEARKKRMQAFAENHHLKNFELHIHHDKKVVEGITHFDQMDNMDMIALGTHGRKGISKLLKGSVAETLINQLHKPVLVYKI